MEGVSNPETVTWSGHRTEFPPTGCVAAHLILNPLTWPGYAAMVVLPQTSWSLWWGVPLLIPHVCLVVAVAGAATGRRFMAHTAEFTGQQVVLTTDSGQRTLKVAQLTELSVEHHGVVGEGYTRTSLRLRWPKGGGAMTVSIVGPYDAALAPSLTALLGRRVRETWADLHQGPQPGGNG